MKILVTGSNGRFAKILKNINSKYNFIYTTKKNLDITSLRSIKNSLKKNKPKYVIHLAGLSRPMSVHNKRIKNSIDLNIIGTCNLVKICSDLRIKIIYFSTSYVYPGTKGNYREIDGVLPWSNYAWSKLGGECAVQMYKNSLILRVCMTEKPFIHKYAFSNVKTNFIYHEDFVKLFLKLINKRGIFNIGGKTRTVFNFVKKENKNIKKKISKGEFPLNQDMNLTKLNKFIK
ncbi:sugar nucleotide-binding protein [Pelagibacteraceae bacterium]|nr:sugar nucleotide-binding protein [Pelagibacteraceae bacterium]